VRVASTPFPAAVRLSMIEILHEQHKDIGARNRQLGIIEIPAAADFFDAR